MSATVDTNRGAMSVGIRIRSDKDLYHRLMKQRQEVEEEFEDHLNGLPRKTKSAQIFVFITKILISIIKSNGLNIPIG